MAMFQKTNTLKTISTGFDKHLKNQFFIVNC